jgi:sugar phosphate isomerase/epimerase
VAASRTKMMADRSANGSSSRSRRGRSRAPRVGLHQVAFLDEGTPAFLDHCRRIGVQHTTLVTASLMRTGAVDEAQQALAAGAPRVEAVNHQFAFYPNLDNDRGEATEKLLQAIDIGAALGARSVYLQTGGRGCLTWEQAAERFAALIAPCAAAAAAQGIRVLVENAPSFNADIHIAHTLADTITWRNSPASVSASNGTPVGWRLA